MKIKKILLGLTLVAILGFFSKQNVKAEWVDPTGTARGFSSSFFYTVDAGWNKGTNQQSSYDELITAGAEYRLYSDGQLWTSLGFDGIIDVTNGGGSKTPITKVEIANPSIASVVYYGGDVVNSRYYITALNYGVTSLFIQRQNGDSFTVPINVVPRAQIANDEGRLTKDVVLGLGQIIDPVRETVNRNDILPNLPLYEKVVTSDSSVVSVTNNHELIAKGVGTAIVEYYIYDTLTCRNKYHYYDDWAGRKITYSIRVQEERPIIKMQDEKGELLNQKIIEKKVGDKMRVTPSLPGVADVVWKFESDNENVASVDQFGLITAKSVGTVSIIVRGGEQFNRFTLNVTGFEGEKVDDLKDINLNIPGNKLILGNELDLLSCYTTVPEKTKLSSFIVSSSDNNIIEIKNSGTLVTKNVGQCTITVVVAGYGKDVIEKKVPVKVCLASPTITIKNLKKMNVITISKVPSATSYTIYRSTKNNGPYVKIGTTKQSVFTDKKAKKKQGYFYKVIANCGNASCDSEFSNTVASLPKQPKIKKISKKGSAYLIIIDGENLDGYEIYYGKNKKCKKRVGVGKSKKLAVVLKLKKKKTYYFKARGIKNVGNGTVKSKFSKVYKLKIKK